MNIETNNGKVILIVVSSTVLVWLEISFIIHNPISSHNALLWTGHRGHVFPALSVHSPLPVNQGNQKSSGAPVKMWKHVQYTTLCLKAVFVYIKVWPLPSDGQFLLLILVSHVDELSTLICCLPRSWLRAPEPEQVKQMLKTSHVQWKKKCLGSSSFWNHSLRFLYMCCITQLAAFCCLYLLQLSLPCLRDCYSVCLRPRRTNNKFYTMCILPHKTTS